MSGPGKPNGDCDVLVVGGGPAGATAAALFAKEGFAVRLADRAVFPRFKPCGDFVSPEGNRILRRLGVLDEVTSAGARPLRGLLVSAYGEPALRADFDGGAPGPGYALERARLDAILLGAARRAGAEVVEGATVEGLAGPGTVRVRSRGAERAVWRARLVVGAGGRRCPVARDLGVQRRGPGDGRIDLLSHWTGLDPERPYCEMHAFGPGYTGVAASAPDRVNVNTVVPASWIRRHSTETGAPEASRRAASAKTPAVGGVESPITSGAGLEDARGESPAARLRARLYGELLLESPAVRRAIRGGRPAYPPVASDITPLSTVRASGDGILLAGDAALFIDPFTGQGIYLALRSAEMVFEVGAAALAAGRTDAVGLRVYDRWRSSELAPKVRLSRLLQAILYRPSLARAVAAALRRDRLGARSLIGVIGDYRPADDLLAPEFLGRLAASGLT